MFVEEYEKKSKKKKKILFLIQDQEKFIVI
jgi:hypothetical protein